MVVRQAVQRKQGAPTETKQVKGNAWPLRRLYGAPVGAVARGYDGNDWPFMRCAEELLQDAQRAVIGCLCFVLRSYCRMDIH